MFSQINGNYLYHNKLYCTPKIFIFIMFFGGGLYAFKSKWFKLHRLTLTQIQTVAIKFIINNSKVISDYDEDQAHKQRSQPSKHGMRCIIFSIL
jgi:hypothetical protein